MNAEPYSTLRTIRVATYNVHACVGTDGQRSESRIAEVIASLDADIIGLQELDLNRRRSAGIDQAGLIAEQLGWTRHFHPAMSRAEEQYGDAILSRHPMTLLQAAPLPSDAPFYCRETRAALWVDVETPLGRIHVFNTHFGLGRLERLAQARLLIGPEWLGRVPTNEPLIALGDFNSRPGSAAHRAIADRLRDARSFFDPQPALRSFPTLSGLSRLVSTAVPRLRGPQLAIDHIFLNEHLQATGIEVVMNSKTRLASDHFPVVAEIRLAGHPSG